MRISNEFKTLLISTALVVMMAVVHYINLLFDGNPYNNNIQNIDYGRASASVNLPEPAEDPPDLSNRIMLSLDLKCLKSGSLGTIKSKAKQLRLIGHWCHFSKNQVVQAKVVNRSNGLEALVYGLKDNSFTTDYLFLSEGENKIFISYGLEGQVQKASELTFIREPNL